MNVRIGSISVVAPVNPALQWTKRVLFQPFDISKWFTIGFCAWLAYLGQGGGGGGTGAHWNMGQGHGANLEALKEFILQNLYWIIPVGVVVLTFAVVFGVLVTWLSSRGHFMFLDCVARDKAVIAEPWTLYARQGNSLFLFRLVVGFGGLLASAPFAAITIFCILRWVRLRHADWGLLLLLLAAAIVLLLIILVFGIVEKLTKDFVVPIMYLQRCRVLEGWRAFCHLAGMAPSGFLLYLLFSLLLWFAMGMLVVLLVLLTCCVAGCILLLPYLGTVLLLPLLVFQRSYSALYLAQYGVDYDVFRESSFPSASSNVV